MILVEVAEDLARDHYRRSTVLDPWIFAPRILALSRRAYAEFRRNRIVWRATCSAKGHRRPFFRMGTHDLCPLFGATRDSVHIVVCIQHDFLTSPVIFTRPPRKNVRHKYPFRYRAPWIQDFSLMKYFFSDLVAQVFVLLLLLSSPRSYFKFKYNKNIIRKQIYICINYVTSHERCTFNSISLICHYIFFSVNHVSEWYRIYLHSNIFDALNIFSHSFIDLANTDNMFFAMRGKTAFILNNSGYFYIIENWYFVREKILFLL